MIKIIVTGHGEFSNGLYHAAKMIAGENNNLNYISFEENMNLDDYEKQLSDAIELDGAQGVLILTDLKGGTPFNTTALLIDGKESVELMAGTNLPMLLEASILSQSYDDVNLLANQLVNTGKEAVFLLEWENDIEDDDSEGGI